MGKTYKYNDEQYGNNYEAFRKFKKEHVKKETEDEQEWQEEEDNNHED
jgi:hypothetical protein